MRRCRPPGRTHPRAIPATGLAPPTLMAPALLRRALRGLARSTSSRQPSPATTTDPVLLVRHERIGSVLPPDNHVHTQWSYDTSHETSMARNCEQALAIGLPAIAFTDHLELTGGGEG